MKTTKGIARKSWSCNFAECRKKIGKGEGYLLWHIAPGHMAQRQHLNHPEPTNSAPKKAAAKPKATKKKATTKKVAKKVSRKGKGGSK